MKKTNLLFRILLAVAFICANGWLVNANTNFNSWEFKEGHDGIGIGKLEFARMDTDEAKNFTLELWLNVAAADIKKGQHIINTRTDGNTGFTLSFEGTDDSDSRFRFFMKNTDAEGKHKDAFSLSISRDVSLDKWVHLAFVISSEDKTLSSYVNGELYESVNTITDWVGNNGNGVRFGRYDWNNLKLKGKVADVRIWKSARTATQIKENYNQLLEQKDDDLVLNYQFLKFERGVANFGTSTNNLTGWCNPEAGWNNYYAYQALSVFPRNVAIANGEMVWDTAEGTWEIDIYDADDVKVGNTLTTDVRTYALNTLTLTPGSEYYAKVRTLNNGFYSGWVQTANFTTATAPANVAVANGGVSWTTSAGTWEVEVYDTNDTKVGTTLTTDVNSCSLADVILNSNTEYYVKVRTNLDGFYSDWVKSANFTTPTEPANVLVANGSVSWTTSAGTWEVEVYDTNDTKVGNTLTSAVNSCSLATVILSSNTEYYVQVRTLDNGFYSAWVKSANFTSPVVPANVVIADGGVNWTSSTGSWEVEVRDSNHSQIGSALTTNVNSLSLADVALSSNTEYYVQVRTILNGFYSAWVKSANFTTPANPTDVAVADATATWTSTATSWEVEVYESDDTQVGTTQTVDVASYLLTGLEAGKEYYVQVRATGNGFYSDWVKSANFTTPANPTNVMVTNAIATWTSTAASWEVEVYETDDTQVGTTATVTTATYTLTGLTHNTEYYVQVRAAGNGFYSDWVKSANFTYNDPTVGVASVNNDQLILSVNNGQLVITTGNAVVINIYTIDGRNLRTLSIEAGSTVIDNLATGLYIINNQKVIIR